MNYLNTKQAAKFLGLSDAMVKVHAIHGKIGKLVCGRYLFTATELKKFAKIPRKVGRKKNSEKNP